MSLVNPYCTVAQVQAELSNTASALAVAGGELEDAINQVSRHIDNWMGRDYYQHDYSSTPLKFNGRNTESVIGDTLWLKYSPIILLTTVTVNGEVWVEDTDFIRVEDEKGSRLISLNGNFCLSTSDLTERIELIGKFGYVQASSAAVPTGIPLTITKAAILGAAALSGHNQKEVVSPTGDKSTVVSKDFPKAFYELLGKRYRPL